MTMPHEPVMLGVRGSGLPPLYPVAQHRSIACVSPLFPLPLVISPAHPSPKSSAPARRHAASRRVEQSPINQAHRPHLLPATRPSAEKRQEAGMRACLSYAMSLSHVPRVSPAPGLRARRYPQSRPHDRTACPLCPVSVPSDDESYQRRTKPLRLTSV